MWNYWGLFLHHLFSWKPYKQSHVQGKWQKSRSFSFNVFWRMAKESAILVRSVSPAAFLSLVPPAKSDAVWQSDSFFKKKYTDFFKVNNHMDLSACKVGLYFLPCIIFQRIRFHLGIRLSLLDYANDIDDNLPPNFNWIQHICYCIFLYVYL